MTGVVRYQATPDPQELATMERVAEHLARSGMFKDAQQATQAFAKIALGRGLGLDPASSMTAIHIVEGKPELSANLQAAMLRQFRGLDGERYDYHVSRLDRDGCVLAFRRRWADGTVDELGESSYLTEDAEAAGLSNRKGPWQQHRKNMMFARAVSNGVAWFCPEVTYGQRVYSDGEIDTGRDHPIPDVSAEVEAPPPSDDPPSAEHYRALREAVDVLGLDELGVVDLLDEAGVPAGPSIKRRLALASRPQVLDAVRRVEALADTAAVAEDVQDASAEEIS